MEELVGLGLRFWVEIAILTVGWIGVFIAVYYGLRAIGRWFYAQGWRPIDFSGSPTMINGHHRGETMYLALWVAQRRRRQQAGHDEG